MNPSKKQLGFALPLAILIVVVLVIAGGTGYYFYETSCAEKYSSPEKTYSLYIKAMEKGDVDAYLECFTEESQQLLETPETTRRLTPESLKIRADDYKKTGYEITEKTDDRAVMTGKREVDMSIYVFKKEKGNWKIDITELQRDIERVTDLMGTLRRGALEFYYSQHGNYPVLTDTSEDGEFLKVLVDGGHLAEILLDPLHPEYFYEYEGTVDSYTLKCYCEIKGGYCDMADNAKDQALIYQTPW